MLVEAGEREFCKTHIVSRIDSEKFRVIGYVLCGEIEKAAVLAINSQDVEKTQEILKEHGESIMKEKRKEIQEMLQKLISKT